MKKIIPIKGMHCRSCELLIEDRLKEIPEVESVLVSYKNSEATVFSKTEIGDKKLEEAVEKAGYSIGENISKKWISDDSKNYREIFEAFLVVVIIYYIVAKLGLLNINIGVVSKQASLAVVLLVGLTAGLSTCMALVGGLVLGISARYAEKHPEASNLQKFRPHIFFNIGRVFSYIILGGLIGAIGNVLQLSGVFLGTLTIAVGLVMLLLGFQLLNIFPILSGKGLTIPSSISKFVGIKKHHNKEYNHTNSVVVGALTFFLPCGFTQAMQLLAMSSGSFVSGALIMGVFALGTAPGLLGIGGLTSIIRGSFAKKFFKFTGVVVIMLAIFNISNGYNLTGWNIFANAGKNNNHVGIENRQVNKTVQIIYMTQTGSGYTPNNFTIQKEVPVRWVIDAKSPGACSSSIVVPSMNIHRVLKEGENVIEFTPMKAGNIRFTCSMGMYSGNFIVVE